MLENYKIYTVGTFTDKHDLYYNYLSIVLTCNNTVTFIHFIDGYQKCTCDVIQCQIFYSDAIKNRYSECNNDKEFPSQCNEFTRTVEIHFEKDGRSILTKVSYPFDPNVS